MTQLFNNEIKKTKFCQSCADSQGVTDPTGFALTDLLGNVGAHKESEPEIPEFPEEAVELDLVQSNMTQCPNCSFTIEKLRKVGRLGCSECYQSFNQEIAPMLRGMHGANEHCGKTPVLLAPTKASGFEIEQLENQLRSAIDTENFEEAAKLRDKIDQLKSAS